MLQQPLPKCRCSKVLEDRAAAQCPTTTKTMNYGRNNKNSEHHKGELKAALFG